MNEPGVAVVGSRVRLFPSHGVGAGMRRWCDWHIVLLTHEAMANEILIDSTLVHGTAMFRRRWLEEVGGWRDRPWAEDVDLWVRLLESGRPLRQERGNALRMAATLGQRHTPGSSISPRSLADSRARCARACFPPSISYRHVGRCGPKSEDLRDLLEASHDIDVIEAPHPSGSIDKDLYPPMVLVFGAVYARKRWREYLPARGMIEGESFIFVA